MEGIESSVWPAVAIGRSGYRKFRLAPEFPIPVKVQIIVYRRAGFGLLQAQIAFQQVRIAADNPGHDLAGNLLDFSGLQVQNKIGYFLSFPVVSDSSSNKTEHGPIISDHSGLITRKISEQHIPVDPLGRQALKRVFSGRIAQIGQVHVERIADNGESRCLERLFRFPVRAGELVSEASEYGFVDGRFQIQVGHGLVSVVPIVVQASVDFAALRRTALGEAQQREQKKQMFHDAVF